MPRADLLALSADDLAALTNRGTVKRALREVEAGEHTGDLVESPAGDVSVRWSDGAECLLPAGVVLAEGRCSCAAVGLCRHLVRTVLAYQRQAAASAGPAAAPTAPWDPGAIGDDELARHYRPAALAKLREQFQQGLLVELVRGSKPSAHFHLQGRLLRFLVPGDPRYTHCDCAEPAPCSHVPLAVWAFRLLEAGRPAGILSVGGTTPPPVALLDDVEAALLDFAEHGVSGAGAAWPGRLARLENACRTADLVWPAEVVAELAQEQERYTGHDALFAPDRVAALVGELAARGDAIRNDTGALPQLLIRGSKADRPSALGSARFIGLGCGARTGRRRVALTAYLQDSDSGSLVAVLKEFAETEEGQKPRSFGKLAQASAVQRSSFAALGVGQLLLRGGKRTAGCRLLPGRADAGVQPQDFAWEHLRPPAFVEEFAELEARLAALPPSALRPRRVAEDFHVCAVTGAEAGRFVSATQTVEAVLLDARGRRAALVHPFTSRGQAGAEALLAALTDRPGDLRFVSGPVRRGPGGLVVHPVCLVLQGGARRTALQPWIEQRTASAAAVTEAAGRPADDPLAEFLADLQAALGDTFVLGLQRADALAARRWRDLQRRGEPVGFARLARPAAALAGALEQKTHTLRWDARPAAAMLLDLAVLARLAQDLVA
jgi:hypothetical protein